MSAVTQEASAFPSIPGEITETGLALPENLPYDEWERVGKLLQTVERSVRWWIGDWLAFGERKYGEMYAQAIEATGLTYQNLADAVYVASAVEFSRRRENVSWSHHREVAALAPSAQTEWLDRAAGERLSTKELRERIKTAKQAITPDNHQQAPKCRECGHECQWCAVTAKKG